MTDHWSIWKKLDISHNLQLEIVLQRLCMFSCCHYLIRSISCRTMHMKLKSRSFAILFDRLVAHWVIWALLNEWLTVEKTIHQESGPRNAYGGNSVANVSLKKISVEPQVFILVQLDSVYNIIDIIYYLHLENLVWIQFKSDFSIFLRSWWNVLSDYSIHKWNYVVLIFFNKDPWCTVYHNL